MLKVSNLYHKKSILGIIMFCYQRMKDEYNLNTRPNVYSLLQKSCVCLNIVIGEVGQLHRLIVALFLGNYDHDRYSMSQNTLDDIQPKYIINWLFLIERSGQMHHVVKNVHTFDHLFGCFFGSR